MSWHALVLSVHLVLCFILVALVLIQQGKGADMGAAWGGGGANSVFGAGGATSFIVRTTTIIAVLFMVTSILLVKSYSSGGSVMTSSQVNLVKGSVMDDSKKDFNSVNPVAVETKEEKKEDPTNVTTGEVK